METERAHSDFEDSRPAAGRIAQAIVAAGMIPRRTRAKLCNGLSGVLTRYAVVPGTMVADRASAILDQRCCSKAGAGKPGQKSERNNHLALYIHIATGIKDPSVGNPIPTDNLSEATGYHTSPVLLHRQLDSLQDMTPET